MKSPRTANTSSRSGIHLPWPRDFVYRITLSELPYVTSIFPLGGPAGAQTTVELKGWNLPVTTLTQTNAEPGIYPLSVRKEDRLSNRVPFAVDTLPECLEKEPNNTIATAQPVTLPTIVNGRVDKPGDWTCSGSKATRATRSWQKSMPAGWTPRWIRAQTDGRLGKQLASMTTMRTRGGVEHALRGFVHSPPLCLRTAFSTSTWATRSTRAARSLPTVCASVRPDRIRVARRAVQPERPAAARPSP